MSYNNPIINLWVPEYLKVFKSILTEAPVGFAIFDVDGNFVFANPLFLKTHKLTAQKCIGKNVNIAVPEMAGHFEYFINRVIQTGKVRASVGIADLRDLPKNQPRYYNASFYPCYNAAKQIIAVAAVILDVTDVRAAEGAIHTIDCRFRALIEKSFDAVTLVDKNLNIIYTSPSTKKILGYDPDKLFGKNGFSLVFPEDIPGMKEDLKKILSDPNRNRRKRYRLIHKNGSIVWVDLYASNLLSDPAVQAIVVNYRSVTKTKEAEEGLTSAHARSEAIFASVGEGMIATDEKGNITEMNPAAEQMLGFKLSKLKGQPLHSAIKMKDAKGKIIPQQKRTIVKALKTGKKIVTNNLYCIKKNGVPLPVYTTTTPILLDKKITGSIVVFRER